MRPSSSRRSASPVMRRRPSSPASSPSPSPSRTTLLGRRRLWSPPPRKRMSLKMSPSRSSARSTIPRSASQAHLQSVVVATVQHPQLPSRSCRFEHRSQFDSRPPATTPLSSGSEDDLASPRRRKKTPPPSSPPMLSPPPTPRLIRQRPPLTRSGNRGSRFVASTIVASARKKNRPKPPTLEEIERVNSRLHRLAL